LKEVFSQRSQVDFTRVLKQFRPAGSGFKPALQEEI
jgi:hypothetical protein